MTATEPTTSTTPERGSWEPSERALLVVHLGTLVVAGIAMLWFARHQWFVTDEWDPIARRSVFGHGDLGLLDPHNEHWSTIAILIYRAQLAIFGLRTYFPVMAVFVATHLLAAHLMWRVMRRAGADTLVATALVAVFAFMGSQSFDFLFAWNLTFSGAVACGLAALLVMPRTRGWVRADAWVWLLLVASLAFSGVGVTMAIVVVAYAIATRGWLDGARIASVPAVIYGIWLAGWGGSTATGGGVAHGAIEHLPQTMWKGVTFAFDLLIFRDYEDAKGHTAYLGSLVVVVLLGFLVWSYVSRRAPAAITVVCALGAPVFFAITSLRRYGLFENEWIHFPRYSYVALTLMLPVVAVAISSLGAWRVAQLAVLGLVVVGLLVHQVSALDRDESARSAQKQEIRARLVAAARLSHATPTVTDLPAAECCSDLDLATLRKLGRDGKLPDLEPSLTARTDARTHLQIALVSGDLGVSGPEPVVHAVDDVSVQQSGTCARVTAGARHPIVRLLSQGRTRVVLMSKEGGALGLWFPRSGSNARDLPPSTDVPGGPALAGGLQPGLPATLEIAQTGGLLIRLPVGSTTRFCDAKAAPGG